MRCALTLPFHSKAGEIAEQRDPNRLRRRARWLCVVVVGAHSAVCLSAGASGAGSVAGSVVDDTGASVAGARVLISHVPAGTPAVAAPPAVTGSLAAMVSANATGSFQAEGLAPGQYIACAEVAAPGLLDPCHWAAAAPNFTVTAGQTTSGVKIVMAKGSILQVHVNDPLQLLGPATGPVDLNFEVHVVTSKGIHYSAPIQASTATGRDHAITIPFGAAVTLRVLSAHLAVSDQSGSPFPPLGTAVPASAGATLPTVELTVTGRK
jgi:hypothetical protein